MKTTTVEKMTPYNNTFYINQRRKFKKGIRDMPALLKPEDLDEKIMLYLMDKGKKKDLHNDTHRRSSI